MKRKIVPGGILALSLATVLLAAPARGNEPASGTGRSSAALYVALGDSVAATPWRSPGGSYVDRLFLHYQSTLGVTQLSNRAQGGETSSSIRTGGQLDRALADINAASDTRAVTIDIGGNDALRLLCRGMTASGEIGPIWDSCPFRYNFFATLSDLKAALDSDPGPESFAAMAYYNPASGLGGDGQPYSEPVADRGLLGTDRVIDCEITAGTRVGLNDVIYQEAGRRGVLVADPYLAFKEGGQSFMADDVHPNDAGHAAITNAFREARPVCPEAGELPPPSELVESIPLDLQLSGKKKQSLRQEPPTRACLEDERCPSYVQVNVGCGDVECAARAKGKLTKVKKDKLKPIRGLGNTNLEPGQAETLALGLTKKARKQVRKALDKDKKVKAKVTVKATDAAGNVATAKRTIKLVK